MHPGARVWAAALGVSLALSIARALGLSDVVFAPTRAACSAVVALCAIGWVARDARMNIVAGLLTAVAWFDVVLLPVDLGWRAAIASDVLLSLGAILVTVTAYLVMATTHVPSDRRGLAAAVSWLAFGAASVLALATPVPGWAVLCTLALAVVLTMRFVLAARLLDLRRDDEDAVWGLYIYRTALSVHVLLACVVWPVVALTETPDAFLLVLVIPYLVMIAGIGRFAASAPHPLASIAATATVLVPLLEAASTLGAVEPWHARVTALVGFATLALSLQRFHRPLAFACALGFVSIPGAFRIATNDTWMWIAGGWSVVVVAAFVHLVTRAETKLS